MDIPADCYLDEILSLCSCLFSRPNIRVHGLQPVSDSATKDGCYLPARKREMVFP